MPGGKQMNGFCDLVRQLLKHDLADAILSADNHLIGDLRREDLELLLS